jgi:type 1 glutamine amidotransferase
MRLRTRFGLGLIAALLLGALWVSGQQTPGAQGRGGRGAAAAATRQRTNKKVVLAWADTRNGIGQHESVSHALAVIERLGYESGVYDTYIRTDSAIISKNPVMTTGQPASGGPSLASVDSIFFLGHREIDLNAQQKADLLSFVRDEGKGFVAGHTGTTAFMSWPEFADMIGGQYDDHPWGVTTAPVITEDPAFPATQHFPPVFTFTDEFYQTKGFSRDKSRVLLRLDMSKLPQNANVRITNGDFPLAWAKMYGKGRVFYSSLGHDSKTWDNPDVYRMYFEAIKWALRLTDAEITPRSIASTGVQK